ncbi:unnamed protein product, partial [Musa hybrid cultivar]
GCDGCIRLDDTSMFMGEKTAKANKNSVRGFDVIDRIKAAVDSACNRSAVSCTEVLVVAARDSVAAATLVLLMQLGGPSCQVQLGRRDSRTASKIDATSNNPALNGCPRTNWWSSQAPTRLAPPGAPPSEAGSK